MCEEIYISNPSTWTCENVKYLGSIINDSVITCNKIIEASKSVLTITTLIKTTPTKTVPIKTVPSKTIPTKALPTVLHKKKIICTIKTLYILLNFFIDYHVTIANC